MDVASTGPPIESRNERSPRPLGHLALRRGRRARPVLLRPGRAAERRLGRVGARGARGRPRTPLSCRHGRGDRRRPDDAAARAARSHSPKASYYGHKQLFDHIRPWGVEVVEYDQTGAPPEGADLILLEAPSNPMLTMPDFEAAAAHPAPVVCDATLSSPLRLRPLERGLRRLAAQRHQGARRPRRPDRRRRHRQGRRALRPPPPDPPADRASSPRPTPPGCSSAG